MEVKNVKMNVKVNAKVNVKANAKANVKAFRPIRDLSLKWSFVLYATICIIVVFLLSIFFSGFFSWLQNDIKRQYEDMYRDELAKQAYLVLDEEMMQDETGQKETVQGESIWIFTEDIRNRFSERDFRLYNIYGILNILAVPIVSVLCVIATGVVFYLRKIKKPLLILDHASSRITAGDLDFKVEYDSRNEFGRLAASFEAMRKSLFETNREMWHIIEERRRLNAAFAHDLRTPLTVLRGYCDFLLKYVPEGKISHERAISTLSTMDVYLTRLEGYTTTMSSLQKLDEMILSPKMVSFNRLCDELKSISAMLASKTKVNINCDCDGMPDSLLDGVPDGMSYGVSDGRSDCESNDMSDRVSNGILARVPNSVIDGLSSGVSAGVPDGASGGGSGGVSSGVKGCVPDKMLYVDLSAVSRTYENLLSNAVRYAKNEVKVSCKVKNDILSITVADDGPGFTPEALKKATEPYFSTDKNKSYFSTEKDTSKDKPGDMSKDVFDVMHFGIGLYICRMMCEKHGGELVIENDGGGKVTANFAISLHNNLANSPGHIIA